MSKTSGFLITASIDTISISFLLCSIVNHKRRLERSMPLTRGCGLMEIPQQQKRSYWWKNITAFLQKRLPLDVQCGSMFQYKKLSFRVIRSCTSAFPYLARKEYKKKYQYNLLPYKRIHHCGIWENWKRKESQPTDWFWKTTNTSH